MGLVTGRPNAEFANTWSVVGAANGVTALSDNSDSSYLQASAPGSFEYDISDPAGVPANAILLGVMVRLRGISVTSQQTVRVWVYNTNDGYLSYYDRIIPTGSISTFDVGFFWDLDPADIASVRVRVQNLDVGGAGYVVRIHELYVDYYYNERPSVTVTTPVEGSTVTGTTRPSVAWTFTDPDSSQQKRHIKIFSSVPADPETSTPVYDSGELGGSDTSQVVTVDLQSGQYYAYVKVKDHYQWSAWDSNAFTLKVDVPAQPLVYIEIPAGINADGYVDVDFHGHNNLLTSNQSSIETDTTGWQALQNLSSMTRVAAGDAPHGSNVLQITANGVGIDGRVGTTQPSVGGAIKVACAPGQLVGASVRVKQSNAAARYGHLVIAFWNAANGFIGYGTVAPEGTLLINNEYRLVSGYGTAPANTAFVTFEFRWHTGLADGSGTPPNGEQAWLDTAGIVFWDMPNALPENEATFEVASTLFPEANVNLSRVATVYGTDYPAGVQGAYATQFQSVAAGAVAARTNAQRITPGQPHAGRATIRPGSGYTSVDIGLVWFTEAGALISNSATTQYSLVGKLAHEPIDVWTANGLTAPNNAHKAAVRLQFNGATGGGAFACVDAVSLHAVFGVGALVGYDRAYRQPGWTPGGFTQQAGGQGGDIFAQRSTDYGKTWQDVILYRTYGYGGSGRDWNQGGTDQTGGLHFRDYTAPPQLPLMYRGKGHDFINAVGTNRYSEWGVASAPLEWGTSPIDWWLKDPLDYTKNMKVILLGSVLKREKKEDQAVFNPLGRPAPVVLRGQIRKEILKGLVFEFMTEANYDKFLALRATKHTLLLQKGGIGNYEGEEWYGVIASVMDVSEAGHDYAYKTVQCDFIETDAPSVVV